MHESKNIPPKLATRLINWFVREDLIEEVLGDLEEKFYVYEKEKSSFRAKLNYWYQVFNYIRPFAIGKSKFRASMNYGMYRSNFKVGYRNLVRNKWYSLVNIGGLALGIGISLVICQYLYFELNYDKFHDNFQNTYRVIVDKTQNGIDQGPGPFTTYALAENAIEEIPEISDYIRFYPSEYGAVITNSDNTKSYNEDGHDLVFADNNFFEIFNFPLKSGNQETALDDINSIVITEKTARKYFGTADPIGKTLKINGGSSYGICTITGVLENLPVNSHLQFEFLRPMENLWEKGNGGSVNRYGGWAREWFGTYLVIDQYADLKIIGEKLNQLINEHKGKWNDPENVEEKTRLQPIADIHLKSDSYSNQDYAFNKGNIKDVRVFALIALFIILIAWINYINLSTARSIQRAKEVGIRKSIGAFKGQLIGQFLIESTLVNCIAVLLSIGIAYLALPVLSGIIGIDLELNLFKNPQFWFAFVGISLIGNLVSGFYPAFVLSAYKPVGISKTGKTVQTENFNLRRGLVTFQFLTSLLLIAGTYLVYQQITFMKNQELGLNMEKVLVLKGPKFLLNAPKVTDGTDMVQIRAVNAYGRSTFETFQESVIGHHSISHVTGSRVIPGQVRGISDNHLRKFGTPESEGHQVSVINIGRDFIKTYDLELVAGNLFNDQMTDDDFVIINEEAVRTFGFGSAQNAVQEKITYGSAPITVVGVVKNFHWQSLRDPHTPYVLRFDGGASNFISFKLGVSNIKESLRHIKSVYNTIYPQNAFDYFFLEDDFNRQYQADTQFGNLFLVFTILAILIACIGLFALVSFSASLRTKEIGIRKVLGASTHDLMMVLSKEYLNLLLIAIIIATPVILYFGKTWLDNYAFRTNIGLDLVLIPSLILILVSVITVSSQTRATATANPVDSLKSE